MTFGELHQFAQLFRITDDTGRLIFADYLEEQGHAGEAWYFRLFTEANRSWLEFMNVAEAWVKFEAEGEGFDGPNGNPVDHLYGWVATVKTLRPYDAQAKALYQMLPPEYQQVPT